MSNIIFLKGVPGSGKSTWAKEAVRTGNGNVVRINKDDLRAMMFNGRWSKRSEEIVVKIQKLMATDLLMNYGVDVIVDNTHIGNDKHEQDYREIASEYDEVEFSVKQFDLPYSECVSRDLKRDKSVGEKVIRRMWRSLYGVDPAEKPKVTRPPLREGFEKAIIVDIDGTIADMRGKRSPYDYSKVSGDIPKTEVLETVQMYGKQYKVLFVSGREGTGQCRKDTEEWLEEHYNKYFARPNYELIMRKAGDKRPDDVVKKEIHDDMIYPRYDVKVIFDDRDRVVKMWRSLGYTVFQVAEGDF